MAASRNVHVEGVGAFEIRPRTVRVVVAINAEYNRLTEGTEDVSSDFAWLCSFLAYLKIVIESSPEGWIDPYDVDPEDEAAMARLHKVYAALKAAEGRFRDDAAAQPQVAGTQP